MMPERASQRRRGEQAPRQDGPAGVRGLLKRVGLAEVYNPSMRPTLLPGDQLLVKYGAVVHVGDIVVLRHPFQHDLLIVKRIVERREGGWWVTGDNPVVHNDSREFGVVPDELVIARALLRLRPPRGAQRSLSSALGWTVSAVRPLVRLRGRASASSLPRRLRAR